jgi:hypothetical protein
MPTVKAQLVAALEKASRHIDNPHPSCACLSCQEDRAEVEEVRAALARAKEPDPLLVALEQILPYAENYDPAEYGGTEPTQDEGIKRARAAIKEAKE